jgi:hypothetical protein
MPATAMPISRHGQPQGKVVQTVSAFAIRSESAAKLLL